MVALAGELALPVGSELHCLLPQLLQMKMKHPENGFECVICVCQCAMSTGAEFYTINPKNVCVLFYVSLIACVCVCVCVCDVPPRALC